MISNRFVIITPCYNIAKWLPINIHMNLYQSYKNFICVYVDDKSTDNTEQILLPHCTDSNFIYLKNENNGSQAKTFMCAIDYLEKHSHISDNDIIVEVDGDDWLSSVFVLDYLNNIYQNENIWMTYGQYQKYPEGTVGGHYNMSIDNQVDEFNLYRKNPLPYSHLKSYKYHLFNRIDRMDLVDEKTNQYFSIAWDHVLCLPMVEMAGKKRIYRCEEILYILNRSEELQNEGKLRLTEQKTVEQLVRQKKVYNRI